MAASYSLVSRFFYSNFEISSCFSFSFSCASSILFKSPTFYFYRFEISLSIAVFVSNSFDYDFLNFFWLLVFYPTIINFGWSWVCSICCSNLVICSIVIISTCTPSSLLFSRDMARDLFDFKLSLYLLSCKEGFFYSKSDRSDLELIYYLNLLGWLWPS